MGRRHQTTSHFVFLLPKQVIFTTNPNHQFHQTGVYCISIINLLQED
jgi:hypothetical protein